jgi:drug/metabolite transporter (DMT)-like permease
MQSPLKGVLFVSAAVFLFAAGDTTAKVLYQTWNIPLMLAVRYALNAALLLAILWPRYGTALLRVNRPGLVAVRAGVLGVGSVLFGLALQRMPVGETVAINYLAPFLVMLLAVPLLGERVGRWGWIAAAGGFVGVLLIVRPGGGLDPLGVVFALLTALATVGYHLLTRLLARSESTVAMLVWTAILGTLGYGATLPWTLHGPVPDLSDLLLIGILAVTSTFGHFLFTAGYREAPASYLAPVNYLHIVWATLLGWAVFAHVPDALTVAGMAAVLASGALVALRPVPPALQAASSTQTGT